MASIAAKTLLFEPSGPLTGTPSSLTQWKQALKEIKLLYMQRQYKRCVARSSSIFSSVREPIHPVHKVYLYFYTAMCYEAMGRYAHDYSRNKIPFLQSALDCFVTCLGVLQDESPVLEELSIISYPKPCTLESGAWITASEAIPEDTSMAQDALELQAEIESFSASFSSGRTSSLSPLHSPLSSTALRSTSPTESIISSITDIIDKTLGCPEDDPFLSGSDSDSPDNSVKVIALDEDMDDSELPLPCPSSPKNEPRLMPSPLYVRSQPPSLDR